MLTDYKLGVVKLLPMKTHLALDRLNALLAAAQIKLPSINQAAATLTLHYLCRG